jgi:SAM-dependent methyltransferase
MIDQARLAAEGIGNVEFVAGDASSYLFGPSSFDAAISRFGTMFFTEPRAAFANIGRALMRGGRLIMLVWRESEHNEWATAIKRSLEIEETNGSLPTFPDAFSLADQSATSSLLIEAGFSGVTFEEASEPVYYGPTISAALDWICSFANVKQALDRKSEGERRRTLDALRNAVGEHESDTGIWFASRAWIVRSHKGLNLDASPDKLI